MAYTVPQFNLTCHVYDGIVGSFPPVAWAGGTPRLASVPCGLAHGRLAARSGSQGAFQDSLQITVMQLLVAKGTDLRGAEYIGQACDQVECPAGSGRRYFVCSVDDVGKGYTNEYRLAFVQSIIGSWVAPYP